MIPLKNLRSQIIRLTAFIGMAAAFSFAGIDRLDIFDKDGNKLLFVTFQYDAGGKNIGRDVFAADSTFLRHTSFQTNSQGQITSESSADFDSNAVFSTAITTATGSSTFSVFDQFKLDQLGGPVTVSTPDSASYDIKQDGAVINKINYSVSGGTIQRIDVLDNAGAPLYYAIPTQVSGIRQPPHLASLASPRLTALSNGRLKLVCDLDKKSEVKVEFFSVSGRLISVPLKKQYDLGTHAILVDPSASCRNQIGYGAYLVRVSIDDRRCEAVSVTVLK